MDVIDLLRQLIAINSCPPDAKAPGVGGEGPLADYVGRLLAANGFRVEMHEIAPGRPNLTALPRKYLPDQPLLVLEAHLDTVSAENMVVDPFRAEIKDGRMFGRGACDTKGTMAAMLAALVEVTSSTDLHFNVGFVGTAHEEGGGVGARHLVEAGFKADAVLVGEPTSLQPVVAHKGLLRFAITTQGRACHSSRPQQGENAIDRMWAVQADLYQRFEPFWQALSSQGDNTLSLNTIRGGSFINIVPDRCRIEVDARYEPGTDTDKALSELKAVLLNH
ncbi:M20 family peptidase, partial [Candidatus Parcubacteria bacterium]